MGEVTIQTNDGDPVVGGFDLPDQLFIGSPCTQVEIKMKWLLRHAFNSSVVRASTRDRTDVVPP